jgi:hypothetical protein
MASRKRRAVDDLTATAQRSRLRCPQAQEAREFLQTLGLDNVFMDASFDRCYCSKCSPNLPQTVKVAGVHTYELPLGFSGFGVKIPPRAVALNIFERWAVSFHGLKAANVASVLNEGGLLLPGDELLDGTTLRATHTRDEDRHKLYTTPSVLYAEKPIYTEPIIFRGSRAKVVLQCRQQPNFEVCGETIGWEREHPGVAISPHVSNSEIEWFTKRRSSIIPYRILIKLQEPRLIVRWAELPGNGLVKRDEIAKCHSFEFFSVGDVVKATTTLHYPGGTVDEGDLGNLLTTSGGDLMVNWHGTIGKRAAPRSSICKCEFDEFLTVGDIVMATGTLNYGEDKVEEGGIGTLKKLAGEHGEAIVNWPFGDGRVRSGQFRKANKDEFWSVGDVVKAAGDLDYGSSANGGAGAARLIKEGSLGTLVSLSVPVTVDWSPHALGKAQVNKGDIVKCKPEEHLTTGDVVRAAKELTFKFDGEEKRISIGSIGKLVGIEQRD